MEETKGRTPTPNIKTPSGEKLTFGKVKTLIEDIIDETEVLPKHQWDSKVARFIAFCVDGGLLGTHFNIQKIITMFKNL